MNYVKMSADELRTILDYYAQHPPPWVDNSPFTAKKKKMFNDDIKLIEHILQLLTSAPEHFRNLWNWSQFSNYYLNHNNTYVIWLACQCMAIILQLTESEKQSVINRHMDYQTCVEHIIRYAFAENLYYKDCIKSYINQYITIEEVSLPVIGSLKQGYTNDDLILVNSTKQNVRNLSLAVSAGKVACLVGPVGSGKTALVHYIANITGHTDDKLLTVQLGEEIDSKMMLGSYHCTDIPAEFVWQPGALTMAVIEGKWLLLEDIDSASSDLAAVLVSLIENNSLSVPGFRDRIVPATGFQLFLTRRVITTTSGYYQKQNIATDLLAKHFIQVNVEPLSKSELIEVIEIKFPVMKTIATKIIDVFLLFSAGFHNSEIVLNSKSNERLTSTRDLMKWCARIVKYYDATSVESARKALKDAIDIFCCNAANPKTRLELACHVASLFGITNTVATDFLIEHKPTIVLDDKQCITGRISLPRTGSYLIENNSKFALTRSSSCLLERIACAIGAQESVLLVGETGTGKTSTLQLLAKHTGNKLVVLNMNQQSDSVDLIGGYKPVELKIIMKPIREEFESLFRTEFDVMQNSTFLGHISNCFNNREWFSLTKLIKHVIKKAIKKNTKHNKPLTSWLEVDEKINHFEVQLKHCQTAMAFAFVEGSLIQAVKAGYWVLLDEINLASAETLQCLTRLLESDGTVTMYEKSDSKPISRHPNFRLMAAMNPATDVGKKDLPPGIRNRFTEFFVDELTERSDLITLTACYLPGYSAQKLNAISKFYLIAKREAEQILVDGTGHKPHYSLRTYCRAISIASSNPCQSAPRSLYESFCLSFLTQLDSFSHKRVESLIATTMFGEKIIQGVLNQPILKPITEIESYVQFEGYWVRKGDLEPSIAEKYILTDSVKKNLRDLVRAVSLSCFPVLIQGDTCVGKTSLITYLATASGNTLLRINNHEHTDLQEYIGSYSAQPITGQLVFKEGVLVEAMRKGFWIVLDELNLAPTDVLEALNRVLDDNRELFIPETQTVVKAHPGFRLFATQNPPGVYGGRKILSRAFKNRFIEMHFDEIPANELETILFKRCEIPRSYAQKVVLVMKDLQSTRKTAFTGKHGYITLRDLFRWGERYRLANASDNYNWNQHLVDEGFLVLSSKARKSEEEQTILQILEKHFKCSLSFDRLFTLNEKTSPITRHILEKIKIPPPGFEHVYMSKNFRRMVVLSCKAIEFNEPILLVGETGCGKTTICQMIAAIGGKKLLSVNCHQHTESSDFLGGLRPIRNSEINTNDKRLFEWIDGPLVKALTEGHMFLADEISLADDSVLERFNSLLEPERKLLLSEKIGDFDGELNLVAHSDFCFVGTMNPGGDYGKKELSPALRNRLTEIWCENCSDNDDLIAIINNNFSIFHDHSLNLSKSMVCFVNWLNSIENIKNYLKVNITIRDYLIWVKFIESMMNKIPKTNNVYNSIHGFKKFYCEGALMIFVDKKNKIDYRYDQVIENKINDSFNKFHPKTQFDNLALFNDSISSCPIDPSSELFGYNGYFISRGDLPKISVPEFAFDTDTTKHNVIRLLRCMQIENRAILLEGSPGVGKTSLVQAVSKASGHKLTRINLSEQTDVSDLFGADLPTDGGDVGNFEWRDGPFLRALKEGNWILLDELNLASQSVLECLNAVLDHRGELYIPELDRTFVIESKKTRLFACQNPMSEGGARKGLPKSFLNRFLQVYLNELNCENIVSILHTIYKPKAKKFIKTLNLDAFVNYTFSFCDKYKIDLNLRDILRWVDVTIKFKCKILDHLPLLFTDRTANLKKIEDEVFDEMKLLLENKRYQKYEFLRIFSSAVMFNRIVLPRKRAIKMPVGQNNNQLILRSHIHTLNSLAVCMEMNWMPILVGCGSGKTSVIKTLAQLCGYELRILSVNSAMDTVEILGGFEQADFNRHLEEFAKTIESAVYIKVGDQILNGETDYNSLLTLWNEYTRMTDVSNNTETTTMASEMTLFKKRISTLIQITNELENFNLSSSLQALSDRVCSTGNLNSGGKFEWIDSVLVKCLNDGCWLLIDNANLCSPAILDRLNGLLEPNGVLELGEKGIGSDGLITTIKPHKDFRLFLAMDSKHGSISRAMKNRGVEIYMNPLEEINIHDLHSMLELQGIYDKAIRDILIEIHKTMRTQINGSFSINHLLRAAYLISQNIKLGKLVVQTVHEICIDTYVHCLSGSSKENAKLEIDRILEVYPKTSNEFWCPSLKTIDVLKSSNVCYIKQQCNILKQHEYLSDTCIEDLLLCYFGRSSSSDIAIRSQWVSKCLNINNEAIKKFIDQPPNLGFDLLTLGKKSVNHIDHKELPYDFRYLPNSYINNGNIVFTSILLSENKIHLMLDHALNQALDEKFTTEKQHKKRIMIADGGILHDYAILSIAFENYLNYFLNESSLVINTSSCTLFKEIIIWSRKLEQIIFEKLDEDSEFITVLLYCYFSIIVKHFVPMMEDLTRGGRHPCLERLKTMRDDILKNYLTPNRHEKLLKLFLRQFNTPFYQCCKIHGDRNIMAHRQNINFISEVKSINIQALTTLDFIKKRDELLMFEHITCKSAVNNTNDTEESNINTMDAMEFNLIPLWELIIERNFLPLIRTILLDKNIERRHFMKSLLQFVPTVSSFYHNLLKNNKLLATDFLLEALKHSMDSIAVENPKLYLEWFPRKDFDLENQDDQINEDMLYSFEQPLFTVFITNLLLKKNEPYYTFAPRPIRLIHNNHHNLTCIKSFIWNSSKWTSDIQFENVDTIVRLIETLFEPLLPIGYSSLQELYSLRDDIACRSAVADKVNFHETMTDAIFDVAKELSHIISISYKYHYKDYNSNIELDELIRQVQFRVGRLWVLSGMCLLEVFSAICPVDPLQKTKFRNECSEHEKFKLKSRLYAERLFCENDGVSELFPFKNHYIKRLKMLNKTRKNIGYRPDPPKYNAIFKEITRFSKMFGLDSNTYNMINSNYTDRQALVNEMDNWLNSVSNFHNSLNKDYAAYPDILSGILLSINQMRYGMRMLKNHYKWVLIKEQNVSSNDEELLTLFGEFPRFCPNIIKMTNMDVSMNINDKFRWYKVCLEELNNMLYLSEQTYRTDKYISTVQYVLEKFVFNWKLLQDEKEKKKIEEDSLYKQKSICETVPIEIEIAQGIVHQFPTTKNSDFEDIASPKTLDSDVSENFETPEIYNLTDKDISDICRLHTEFVHPAASAHWLSKSPIQLNKTEAIIKLKNSFSDRFCLFGKLLMSKFMYLDSSIDGKMIPWLLMATDIANNPQKSNNDFYDFYRDSNIDSAKMTFEVLKVVQVQILSLLDEYPDHPTLQTIIKVVDRIMNFDWSSPTCRFLIGLELLLTKLHEWEEVAHRGVSVNEVALTITHCIQEYRSLELNNWKNCLKSSVKKIKNDSSNWWFHLYSIFQSYLNKQEYFEQLVSAIQKFMESSSLGQFNTRLELLYTFHCDVVCREKTKEQIELCNASWNLYKYYSQFKDCINNRIETLSLDIKKKLHDFVKIVKWNDINYWSVKETVTKVQQTLHKYTREYEEILKNSASSAMVIDPTISNNTKADTYILPSINSDDYLENSEISLDIDSSETVNVLQNLSKYSKKLVTISDTIMKNCSYHMHITELNDIINGVVESAQEFRDLKVNTELSKDKMKSQAKQILQQKHKALSDLFKGLQRLGLSFKAGLMGCEQTNSSIEFARLPPIDIIAALDFLESKRVDNDLRCAWSDCEMYFLKSISQTAALNIASETPKLGLREMDRIKGFINDLKSVTWSTKKELTTNIDSLTKFRSMIYLAKKVTSSNDIMFDPSEDYEQPMNYVVNSINILQQFKVAIQCNNEISDSTSNDSINTLLNSTSIKNKETKSLEGTLSNLDEMIALTQDSLNNLVDKKEYQAMKLCDVNFIDMENYEITNKLCSKLTNYINKVYKKIWINKNNTLSEHLFDIQPFVSKNNEPLLEKTNTLVNQVLKSVEILFKKHKDINDSTNDDKKLLKNLIIEPLSSDFNDFNLTSINKQLKNVLKSSTGDNVLLACLPLFEQYILLVQYFITQQTMAYRVLSKMNYLLSSIFTDLVSNGFCIPEELLQDEDGTRSDGKSGMGLSEGDEGCKDVSDQIESQDQLEDAKKNYDDKTEQDKDIKEEENGIEMSDDFDGKLHDMEKEETENSDNEDSDNQDNQDKEMGDTGENADTLDEQLWGSDSEDENGDDQENQELNDNGKGGDSLDDKQLEAKSNNDNYSEEQDEKEEMYPKNSKKDINEMNEDTDEVGQDHVDPNHGDLQPPPEPEPLDLPDDLQLDDGEMNDNDIEDNNPFDIDTMKESIDNVENTEKDDNEELHNEDKNNVENDSSDEDSDDGNKADDTIVDDSVEDLGLEEKEDDQNNDGGKKDDSKTGEECNEDMNKTEKEAKPSEDDPSQVEAQPSNIDKSGSKDQVCENADGQDNNDKLEDNIEEATGPEQQGTGRSQRECKDTQFGHSANDDKGSQSEDPGTNERKRKMKPGEKDTDRTLAENSGIMKKRLKTTDILEKNNDIKDDDCTNDNEKDQKGELFKHVNETKQGDTETLDAATNEQMEKRPIPNNEDEIGEELTEEMEIEEDIHDETNSINGDELLSEKIKPKNQNNLTSKNESDNLGNDNVEERINVDGEIVLTHTADRGMDTMFHTVDLTEKDEVFSSPLSVAHYKEYIKNQFEEWVENGNKKLQKYEGWDKCVNATSSLAQELSEQLRLVLEPSKASKLQGDFRTGKRINMRRIIPYIASQYKKDKIWLRRTKPSKREYQIIIAVDNSSSMQDSHAKVLAFDSLALVSNALTLIEAGELGVMSFGKTARILHPLGEPFSNQSGAKLMLDFTFDEQNTNVGQLIELATAVFDDRGQLSTSDKPAQLLVIMSDGRGIQSEGPSVVKNAIRAAKVHGIFIVFIIIDNPTSKESILDIKMPIFENNSVRIESYMDNFPFPFYVILRDVNKLPSVLSDALREWFELVIA